MSQRVIARRFALALSDTIEQNDELRAMEQEIGRFGAAVEQVPELHDYLVGPLVPAERKGKAAILVLESLGATERGRRFVMLLLERHRIGLAPLIAEEFSSVVLDRLGIVDAEVTSAMPMDDAMQERTRTALTHLARKEVRASFNVDPSLVGGLRARIGSTIYDGSVRGRMNRLRERIVKE
jgi:F-type H+-transporting ATPase subunit delta